MDANMSETKRLTSRMGEQLKGRVAIVTGAASGLGRAIAVALAAEETAVVINDVDEETGRVATQGIIDAGGDAMFVRGDVSRVEDVRRLIDATMEKYKRIDILVNNAGLQHIAPITEFTDERWNYLIGVMLTGPFLTTKHALPHMQAQKRGRIINISSTQGLVSAEFKSAYVSAKHGVIGLTKVTALEGAPHNITAVAVCPSFIRTSSGEANRGAGQVSSHTGERGRGEDHGG